MEFLEEEEEDTGEEDHYGDGVMVTRADYTALKVFKHALDDPHGVLRSWNESVVGGMCNGEWIGIKCVRGPIPRSLSFLNHLWGLYLFRNLLSGTIPPGLGASSKYFQSINLSHNLLSGAIPTSLVSSPNIYKINLSSNIFIGSIPSDISARFKESTET